MTDPQPRSSQSGMRLYNDQYQRLYLNRSEREAFLAVLPQISPIESCFSEVLALTGCRISEATSIRPALIQVSEGIITVRTLKRRKTVVMREIPVPVDLTLRLASVFAAQWHRPDEPLWQGKHRGQPMNRSTGYRWVKSAMASAGIQGAMASPKGLRHGFGIHAVLSGVQLHMLQKWMGHASITTTMIYANAVGPEEREIAQRMW